MNTRVKTRPNMMEKRSSFSSDFWGVLHTCVYTPTPPTSTIIPTLTSPPSLPRVRKNSQRPWGERYNLHRGLRASSRLAWQLVGRTESLAPHRSSKLEPRLDQLRRSHAQWSTAGVFAAWILSLALGWLLALLNQLWETGYHVCLSFLNCDWWILVSVLADNQPHHCLQGLMRNYYILGTIWSISTFLFWYFN